MNVLEYIWTVLYFLLWIGTLSLYQWKCKKIDGGTAIIASYCIYSFCAILTLDDPLWFTLYPIKEITLFPYLYLFVMLLIALSPTIYFHVCEAKRIEDPQTRMLSVVVVIIIISGLCMLPNIITHFGDGVVKLLVDSEAGKDAYNDKLMEASDGGTKINNIASIIFNSFSDIAVFLFFYYLTLKNKSVIVIIGLALCMVITVLQPIINGLRGPVIISISTIIMSYMFMKGFMSYLVKKIARIIGIAFVSLVSLPIIAITFSRFGNSTSDLLINALLWYVGQGSIYFNSYALDPGGIRYGDRVVNLFKRLIDPSTPANFVERRMKYHNLELDDNLFSTFVGDFCIDFGPILAFIIFVVFNLFVLNRISPKSPTIKLHQIFLLFFSMCICMQGGMALFSYADTGNLKIIVFAMVYFYLYYHDKLLMKYPKIKQ